METSSGGQQSLLCSKKEGEEDNKSQCWFSTSVANGSRKSEGPRGYKGYQNEWDHQGVSQSLHHKKSQEAYAYNSAPEEKNHLDLFSSCVNRRLILWNQLTYCKTSMITAPRQLEYRVIQISKRCSTKRTNVSHRLNRKSLFQRWRLKFNKPRNLVATGSWPWNIARAWSSPVSTWRPNRGKQKKLLWELGIDWYLGV